MSKHGRYQEEAKKYLQEKQIIGDRMFEKWSRTDIGAGLKGLFSENAGKARNVAMSIENVERHLRQLNETIISQNFQTTPENVLKIVRIGTANSHRGDIFTEVPLTTTDDALYFIDMTYENTVNDKGQTAGEKIYEKAYYNSVGTAGNKTAVGSGATQYTITASNAPILKYKVHITLDGALIGYDDGAGNITRVGTTLSATTSTWNVVNYTTGAVKLEFTSGPTAANTIAVIYEWDSEQSALYGQYPKVSLTVAKKRFLASLQPLGYTYTTMTEILLGTTGLGNAEELLIGAVGDEHAKARDYKAIALAHRVAKMNSTYAFDADFAAAGEVSDKLHSQKVLSVINDIGGDIYNSIKRGQVNKVVAGSKAVTYMMKHDLWKNDDAANKTGVYHAGTLAGIDIYSCPADAALVASNEALLTYKNPNEGLDVGIAFGVLTEVTAALAYPQFYIDGNVGSVEDAMIINKDFVRKLTFNNLPNYVV